MFAKQTSPIECVETLGKRSQPISCNGNKIKVEKDTWKYKGWRKRTNQRNQHVSFKKKMSRGPFG